CPALLSVILIHWNACASILEAGAQCISSARWDLYGGCRVIGIPTVISWKSLLGASLVIPRQIRFY
ncbi:MAG TPA: hypothetical protein VMW89_20200, partial [Desulfatiglandales bacterium]|nr:hypothetical protein [Desulfatiglandales bacterium]